MAKGTGVVIGILSASYLAGGMMNRPVTIDPPESVQALEQVVYTEYEEALAAAKLYNSMLREGMSDVVLTIAYENLNAESKEYLQAGIEWITAMKDWEEKEKKDRWPIALVYLLIGASLGHEIERTIERHYRTLYKQNFFPID